MNETKACGVFVMRESPESSFLLMQHKKRWDLPKGHLDDGETEVECALRELEEETGICESDIQLDPDFRYSTQYTVTYKKKFGGGEALKTLVIFLGRLTSDVEIEITEHIGFQWFPWDPPHKIQKQAIDPILDAVHQYLSKQSA